MKKITCFVLAVCLLVAIPCSAYAQVVDTEELQPRWVVSCPSGGKHQMTPRGKGYIYTGNPDNPGVRLDNGYLNQCTLCNEAIWSEYKPNTTHKLGNYKVLGVLGEVIPITGTNCYLNGRSLDYFGGNVLSDSYWQGYTFLI